MLFRPYPCVIILCTLAKISEATAQIAPTPVSPAANEGPVELSVFEVTADEDIGYQSTNAAEVTRMNTRI